jgi:predicted nuclease with TOPRIM domain
MSTQAEAAPTLEAIAARIQSMEAELAHLKEQVRQLQEPKPVRTLGDLYGILSGQVESTEADIDAALLRVDWEDAAPENRSWPTSRTHIRWCG